ncbi:MAG: DUF4160 domain-containing protein [Planctomycetaceae bacterium]|jgi:hypothetical protein|nr:DUF4160 domain-containing protein [Planctomycetaceae bacterium]
MSPTVLIYQKYRFFFNSREETRKHIHVQIADGTAKFWLEPIISLADFNNMSIKDLNCLMEIIKEKKDEFIIAWNRHFDQ